MTVATLVSTVSYTSDGISTIYPYPFYLIDAAHLQVWVNGALLPVNLYTVTSVGNQFGGEVRLNVAPAVGLNITLRRHVPATQLVDYRPYDPFPAEVHEQALDKLTMIVQEQDGFIANAIRAPLLEPVGAFNLVLPIASVRANFTLGFDAAGNLQLYPNYGPPPSGITDHGALTGLADDDHPQYMLRSDLAGSFLPLAGGTMTGAIQLPAGFPVSATEAVNKAYVDTFVGSVITKNVISNATGDAQGTVQGAWNAQANASGITRASNEIIYYRWKSTDTVVYRYVGAHQGPAGWATVAGDWAAASGVNEAPLDGFIYGRKAGAWAKTIELTGGAFLGKVQGFAGAAAAADLARTDEAMALDAAVIAAHVALLDPHTQYVKKSGFTSPGLFPDGVIGAPGISWANEPTAGFFRSAPNNFNYVIDGVAVIGLNKTAFAFGAGVGVTVAGAFSVAQGVTFQSALTVIGVSDFRAQAFMRDVVVGGTGAACVIAFAGNSGNFGTVSLHTSDGAGSSVPVFRWTPVATSLGNFVLDRLFGGATMRLYGGAFNTGVGATIQVGDAAATTHYAAITMPFASGSGSINFCINNAGTFDANGTMSVRRNPQNGKNQMLLNAIGEIQATQGLGMAFLIQSTAAGPGIGLLEPTNGNHIVTSGGSLYIAQQGGGGPAGTWLMYVANGSGQVTAGSFNPVSDRRLKENVRPLTGALAGVLKLAGIRYRNQFSKREDIGLIAQDVQAVYPELVGKDNVPISDTETTEVYTLNYGALAAPMIEALRELDARLKILEAV